MIAPDVITLWHRVDGAWERSCVRRVRTEYTVGDKPSTIGPSRSDDLTVYAPKDVDVAEGDRIAQGDIPGDTPVDSSLRVASVHRWTGRTGLFHHVEVIAR